MFHPLVEFSILASASDPFDPIEQAFQRLGQRFLANTEHLHRDWTLVQEYGLTPELRAMSQRWKAMDGAAHVVAAKGAPEAIMDLCHLGADAQARIVAAVETLATEGLRVLAVAQARFTGADWPAVEHGFDFVFIGLLGLSDPLRAEIPAAVAECRAAGIRVVMITGDYSATARTIARQAGLAADNILSGDDLTALSDAQLQDRMKSMSVCARIASEQNLRIVQALKVDGEITAMTGDGVNDAPALKVAHVGIAMGGRGTDVARGRLASAVGRQLSLDRAGGAAGSAHLRQYAQVHVLYPVGACADRRPVGGTALGLTVASYQSWLQLQPANTLSCSGGQFGLIERLVEWLGQQAPILFLASSACEETELIVLGLSLANWAMVAFATCLAIGGWALVHECRV